MLKATCQYCGNNPVPHRIYWYNESLNILLTPLRQKLLYNWLTRFIKKNHWDQKLLQAMLYLGESIGLISRQKDPKLCKVRRAQVLWEEANKRGLEMQELLLLGKPFDCYVVKKSDPPVGGRNPKSEIIFSGLPRPLAYSNKWLDLMDDKWLLKKVLLDNYLPVPAGGPVTNFSQALKIFGQISKPVIVKPRAGSRGRHSTTFVNTQADLKQAVKVAKQLCYWVIVEEQLWGPVYRATLVNFELCGVLRGDTPQITGDGQQTIAELIEQKNQLPHPGVSNIIIDSRMELFLFRQNLKLSSLPENNQVVSLSEKIGVNYGGSSSEDFEICHPDNKELFVEAARILADPIVGFDFIIPDITKSYKTQKCGFIEVNSLPFINLHYDPLLGQGRNVAANVWAMLGW